MRLLHTSDWHLGRESYRVSRRVDHDAVIGEITDIARRERVDLVIHSGDLFDGIRPPIEDLLLAANAIQELASIAPIVVVCGNHDSPALLRLFTRLLGAGRGIHLVDVARRPADGGLLRIPVRGGSEVACVAPLPFIHANRLVTGFEDPTLRTALYADRVGAISRVLNDGLTDGYDSKRDVLLIAAHLFVGGATFSGSERGLHVSEDYLCRLEALPAVSYAAMGHIHKPQALPGGVHGRYAGSPLQLDLGEAGEGKEVVLVEATPGRPARIEVIALTRGRGMRRVAGTLAELARLDPGPDGTLLHVTVHSQDPVTDVGDRVAELFPEATLLEVAEVIGSRRLDVLDASDVPMGGEQSLRELFHDFLAATGTRQASASGVLAAFDDLLARVETEAVEREAAEAAGLDVAHAGPGVVGDIDGEG